MPMLECCLTLIGMSFESKKITAQILDLFSELDWGSQKHGNHTVTNEKSKKRRKHKEYINRNK